MKVPTENTETKTMTTVKVASVEISSDDLPALPASFVPTPTIQYRAFRKTTRATLGPGLPRPIPIPPRLPLPGARVLIWKQDPSVGEIGIRKAYLPGHVFSGPKDARISVEGVSPVVPNVFGDLIEAPGTEAFDAVHTFAVVRSTLTLFQRGLNSPMLWQWNTPSNANPLKVFPRAGVTMNAYYSRNETALKFFYFNKPGDPPGPPFKIFTCRSFDIVAHETGHAILDALKPNWLGFNNPPQTGGLHESFGDLTAIFLALSQMDQVEAIIAQTKSNLHDKTFISDLAEEFGLALGRPNGLRNADNDLKLSEVGTEVHAISQVFTGAIYDILADIFRFEQKPAREDDASVLYRVARYLHSLLIRALVAAPASAATYANVANNMLAIAQQDQKPQDYLNAIRNRFHVREVLASPVALTIDYKPGKELEAKVVDDSNAFQNRAGCCGTMTLAEYSGAEEALQEEVKGLKAAAGGKRERAA